LLGLQAATTKGVAASIYYIFAYAFMTLGAFAVVELVGGKGDRKHDLEDYRGLARNSPVLATTFAVLLLAQAGVPFTTGFFAKVYVVEAAVGAHSYALAVIAMASAAIAVFFYLRVVLVMFLAEPQIAYASTGEESTTVVSQPLRPVLGVSAMVGVGIFLALGVTVVFGIWPAPLVDFARQATLIFQ
jgi:NADH-quinone oxidoreductase subunit N